MPVYLSRYGKFSRAQGDQILERGQSEHPSGSGVAANVHLDPVLGMSCHWFFKHVILTSLALFGTLRKDEPSGE